MKTVVEQLYAANNIKCQVGLGFHPSYNSRNFGADYGQQYYFDPLYRIETDMKVAKSLYQKFGEYGMGNPDPKPVLGVGIQPFVFMNAAMGGRMVFKKDEETESPDKPLSEIRTVEDLCKIGDIDWNSHSLVQNLFDQVEQMKQFRPDLAISQIQGVWQDGEAGQKSFFTMHTPYTTAFRLFGQQILELMILEEDFSKSIFDWLMHQYLSLWDIICKRTGWHGTKIHFGDCAATMLSPGIYERMCLPVYQKIMQSFEGCVVHSCGPSSHLLTHFAQIPKVKQLQLGDGTDLKQTRHLFPGSSIVAYYDPGRLLTDEPQNIEKKLWQMAEQLVDNFQISCGGADPDTPPQNIHAFLKTGKKIKELCA